MDEYECEVCGRVLEDDEKIIIYSESTYWDGDEKHVFFCCNLHASKYIWAIAEKYGAYNPNPNYFFWSRTVAELEEEIDEYEIEKEEEEQDLENEEEFFDDYDDEDEDEDKEIVCEQCGTVLTGKDKVILVEYGQYEPIYMCSDQCYSLYIFHQSNKLTKANKLAKEIVTVDSTAEEVMEF